MKKITKILSLLLVLALSASVLSACGQKKEEPQPAEDPQSAGDPVGPVAGGWAVDEEFTGAQIPEDAEDALTKACEGMDGAAYEPVAYLGSQVVAGVNYALLCKVTPVVPDAQPHLCVVKVYKDLNGGAEILSAVDIDVSKYTEGTSLEFPEAGLAGGFTFAEASGSALNEAEQAAFDKALEGMDGVGYAPLACLGHQVVAGTNYAILCKATRVSAEPAEALAVLIIYEDLEGGAAVTSVSAFEF